MKEIGTFLRMLFIIGCMAAAGITVLIAIERFTR